MPLPVVPPSPKITPSSLAMTVVSPDAIPDVESTITSLASFHRASMLLLNRVNCSGKREREREREGENSPPQIQSFIHSQYRFICISYLECAQRHWRVDEDGDQSIYQH